MKTTTSSMCCLLVLAFAGLFPLPAYGQETEQPLVRLSVDLPKVKEFLAAQPAELRAPLAMMAEFGLNEFRVAVFPHPESGIVPVIGIFGDKQKLQAFIDSPNSPIRSIIKPLKKGRYGVVMAGPTKAAVEKHKLIWELSLFERENGLVFAPDNATEDHLRVAHAAFTKIPARDDRCVELEIGIPKELGYDVVKRTLKAAGLEKDMGAQMLVGFALIRTLGPYTDVLENADQISVGLFTYKDAFHVLDLAVTHSDEATANHFAGLLSGEQEHEHRYQRLLKAITDPRIRRSAKAEGRSTTARFAWNVDHEMELARNLGEANSRFMAIGRVKPSTDEVPPVYLNRPPLELPLTDVESRKAELQKAVEHGLFLRHSGSRDSSGQDCVRCEVDLAYTGDLERIGSGWRISHATSANGNNILRRPDDAADDESVDGTFYMERGNASFPVLTNSEFKTPGLVKGTIDFTIPQSIDAATFTATDKPGTTKVVGGNEFILELLENDVVAISMDETDGQKIMEAYDKTGRLLKHASLTWNKSSFSGRYRGRIDHVRFMVVSETATVAIPFEVDLSKKMPTPAEEGYDGSVVRYDRQPHVVYPTASETDIPPLEVRVQTQRQPMLQIDAATPPVVTQWQLFPFGKDGLSKGFRGRPGSGRGGRDTRFILSYSQDHDLGRVVGKVRAEFPVGNEVVRLTRNDDPLGGTVASAKMADGTRIEVEITGHRLKFVAFNGANVLSGAVYDEQGRRLRGYKLRNWEWSGPRENEEALFWGNIHHVDLHVYNNTVERRASFDYTLGEYNAEVVKAFPQLLPNYKKVAAALRQIEKATDDKHLEVATVAALYYAYPSHGEEKPLHAIPQELAVADAAGAKLFKYEHKPYFGYTFRAIPRPGTENDSSTWKAKWEGGEVELQRADRYAGIFAIPADPTSQPTFRVDVFGNVTWAIAGDIRSSQRPDTGNWPKFSVVE